MTSPATLLGLLLAALSIFVEVQSRYIHSDEHILNDMQGGDRMALPMKRRMMLRLPFVENVNNNPTARNFMENEHLLAEFQAKARQIEEESKNLPPCPMPQTKRRKLRSVKFIWKNARLPDGRSSEQPCKVVV